MTLTFEQLIETQGGRVMAIARQYAEPSAVDDLYQEILVQLWRSLDKFRGESHLHTWVYRVGFNTAMTSLRKLVRQRETETKLRQQQNTDDLPSGRCQAEVLTEFMGSLSDIDKSVMIMYLDGLSGQQMADVLGVKVNAVQVRINRLKQTFSRRYVEVA